jgi:hypothetical protein
MVSPLQDSTQQLANLDEEPLPRFKPLKMRRSRLYDDTIRNALLLVVGCMYIGLMVWTILTHKSAATISSATIPLTVVHIIVSVSIHVERDRIAQGLWSLSKKLDRRRTLRSFQPTRRRRQGMV